MENTAQKIAAGRLFLSNKKIATIIHQKESYEQLHALKALLNIWKINMGTPTHVAKNIAGNVILFFL